MHMNRKWAALTVLSMAAIVALALWLMTGRSSEKIESAHPAQAAIPSTGSGGDSLRYPEGAPQLAMIQSQIISASSVPLTEPLSARIAYDEDVTARIGVGISGRIVALKAGTGDTVKVGQVLADIDSPDFGTALADLNKARADEERKRQVLKRAKDLVPGEAIAAKDFEAARADYVQSQAEVARAEQRLKNLNPHGLLVLGQRIGLTSPLNGVVTERTATPALEVNPGMPAPLFVVTDPRRLWLLIDLPEKLLRRVKLGSAVAVESEAYPDERFNAKVSQLGQVVDPNTRRVVVRARLDNSAAKLLPEMFVRASISQDSGSGVPVPNSAIVNRGVYSYVFVQSSAGEFHHRTVKLLTHGSDVSFVGEGLKGGEGVVTTGALLLDAEMSTRAGGKS